MVLKTKQEQIEDEYLKEGSEYHSMHSFFREKNWKSSDDFIDTGYEKRKDPCCKSIQYPKFQSSVDILFFLEAALILFVFVDKGVQEKIECRFPKILSMTLNFADDAFYVLILQLAKPIMVSAISFVTKIQNRRLYTEQYFNIRLVFFVIIFFAFVAECLSKKLKESSGRLNSKIVPQTVILVGFPTLLECIIYFGGVLPAKQAIEKYHYRKIRVEIETKEAHYDMFSTDEELEVIKRGEQQQLEVGASIADVNLNNEQDQDGPYQVVITKPYKPVFIAFADLIYSIAFFFVALIFFWTKIELGDALSWNTNGLLSFLPVAVVFYILAFFVKFFFGVMALTCCSRGQNVNSSKYTQNLYSRRIVFDFVAFGIMMFFNKFFYQNWTSNVVSNTERIDDDFRLLILIPLIIYEFILYWASVRPAERRRIYQRFSPKQFDEDFLKREDSYKNKLENNQEMIGRTKQEYDTYEGLA